MLSAVMPKPSTEQLLKELLALRFEGEFISNDNALVLTEAMMATKAMDFGRQPGH